MTKEKDIVEDIFFRVKEILGAEFKGQIALRLEKEEERVRVDWSGAGHYVPKKNNKKKVREELARGTPVSELSNKTGISRAQVYRLLKQRN